MLRLSLIFLLNILLTSCSGKVDDDSLGKDISREPEPVTGKNVMALRALKRVSSFEKMDFPELFLVGSLDRSGGDLSRSIFFRAYSQDKLPGVESKRILLAENVDFNVAALLVELGAEVTLVVSKYEKDNGVQSYFTNTGYSSVASVTVDELKNYSGHFDQLLVRSSGQALGDIFLHYYRYLSDEFIVVVEPDEQSDVLNLLFSGASGLSSLALAVN